MDPGSGRRDPPPSRTTGSERISGPMMGAGGIEMGTLSKIMGSQGETLTAQMEELTGEEVVAVGHLRQGRKPSMTAMVTGTALLELMRPRRSKALPRQFVLGLTPTRAVAYACLGVADDDDWPNYRVVVRGKERGSWAPQAVR